MKVMGPKGAPYLIEVDDKVHERSLSMIKNKLSTIVLYSEREISLSSLKSKSLKMSLI